MEERELHLRDYLKTISKRRYTVYTFFIVVFSIVLIGTLSSTSLYMATTQVLIEKVEPYSLLMNYRYSPHDPEFYETQYQLIKSSSVAKKVVKNLSLDEKYGDAFKKGGFSNGDQDMSKADMIAQRISDGIQVKPIRNSRIVNISYMFPHPELAKMIVNSVASAYIDRILEMKMDSSRYSLQWMTKKAEDERAKLEVSEKALQEYMKAKDIVTLENRIAVIPQQLSELGTNLIRGETRRKELEELYNRIKNLSSITEDAETIPAIASDPTLQSLRMSILKAERNVTDLSKKYGKKHPSMISALGEIKMLRNKKKQEITRVVESIRNEYELAKANEENLRKLLTRTKQEALDLNEKFIQYGALKREVDSNRQLYDALITKIKEQGITEQVQNVNVWIVEKAETPGKPERPRKALNILLGIIVGLFGGVGLAFFIEYLDNTIKTPDEAETRLGVPVLGIVSLLKSKEKSIEEIVTDEPKSAFAENYRAIRAAIVLSSAERHPQKILVTSMGPDEGKTATSVNLAKVISQSEYSVLLIDADLRRPRVHKIFGLDNAAGLSTYLAGASDVPVVKDPSRPNLGIIPSGPIPPNPSELLSSNRMGELIKKLGEEYDIIISDSPPLLTVADSLILSKLLDETIIVARAGKTTYDYVRKGLKSLHDINAHVLGIIINALDIKKRDYYYYRYYNYYYSSYGDNPEP